MIPPNNTAMPQARSALAAVPKLKGLNARGEYLTDNTGTPEDKAYHQAVSDVSAAIGALLEGGAR